MLFDPVRSAEPPISSGRFGDILLITSSEDCRVAIADGFLMHSFLKSEKILFSSLGNLPLILRTNSLFLFVTSLLRLLFHFLYSPIDLCPEVLHSSNIFFGIIKGL